MYILHIALKIF